MHTPSVKNAKASIVGYDKRLVEKRKELKGIWQRAENRILQTAKMTKYRSKGDKVQEDGKIENKVWKRLC